MTREDGEETRVHLLLTNTLLVCGDDDDDDDDDGVIIQMTSNMGKDKNSRNSRDRKEQVV